MAKNEESWRPGALLALPCALTRPVFTRSRSNLDTNRAYTWSGGGYDQIVRMAHSEASLPAGSISSTEIGGNIGGNKLGGKQKFGLEFGHCPLIYGFHAPRWWWHEWNFCRSGMRRLDLYSLAATRLRCTGREIKARGWDALSENLSAPYGLPVESTIDNRCEILS